MLFELCEVVVNWNEYDAIQLEDYPEIDKWFREQFKLKLEEKEKKRQAVLAKLTKEERELLGV